MNEIYEYFKSFDLNSDQIEKIFVKTTIQNLELIKSKVEDYKSLLKVNNQEIGKMIVSFPMMIELDTKSEGLTSVRTKLKMS